MRMSSWRAVVPHDTGDYTVLVDSPPITEITFLKNYFKYFFYKNFLLLVGEFFSNLNLTPFEGLPTSFNPSKIIEYFEFLNSSRLSRISGTTLFGKNACVFSNSTSTVSPNLVLTSFVPNIGTLVFTGSSVSDIIGLSSKSEHEFNFSIFI